MEIDSVDDFNGPCVLSWSVTISNISILRLLHSMLEMLLMVFYVPIIFDMPILGLCMYPSGLGVSCCIWCPEQ